MSSPGENVRLTPEQWVEKFLAHDHAERINIAENVLRMADESLTCFLANHKARIEDAEHRLRHVRESIEKDVAALVVDLTRLDPYTEGVRDAVFVVRNPGQRPPEDLAPLAEDVRLHTMGPGWSHEDGRVCTFHQRLGVWVHQGSQCLRGDHGADDS